jgi:hypothetical protein
VAAYGLSAVFSWGLEKTAHFLRQVMQDVEARMGKKKIGDLEELLVLGRQMDEKSADLFSAAEDLLMVRDREGRRRSLLANAVQRAFERERGRENIVLKARQMGITTWIAGRFFLKTITARGVMTVQVARRERLPKGSFGLCSGSGSVCRTICAKGRCGGAKRMRDRCVFQNWIANFVW